VTDPATADRENYINMGVFCFFFVFGLFGKGEQQQIAVANLVDTLTNRREHQLQ
jgi:hypothetical protein